jgi:glucose-1-phosphatase
MIKTLIFDLGKVIVDYNHAKIFAAIAQKSDFNEAEIQQMVFSSDLSANYERGKISTQEFYESVKKSLNLPMSLPEFDAAWNSTFELKSILDESLFENLSNKYRLIILSDTNEMHFEFIRKNFTILNYFDDFVLSYNVGAVKPSEQIYNEAIKSANCLPNECFFTDDRLPNVEGAKNVGINAILFETAENFLQDLKTMKLI